MIVTDAMLRDAQATLAEAPALRTRAVLNQDMEALTALWQREEAAQAVFAALEENRQRAMAGLVLRYREQDSAEAEAAERAGTVPWWERVTAPVLVHGPAVSMDASSTDGDGQLSEQERVRLLACTPAGREALRRRHGR